MDIEFEVNGKTYHAHLMRTYMTMYGRDRRVTQCVLTAEAPMQIFSGICVKNPKDGMDYDENYGYRLAFKRALFQMYVTNKMIDSLSERKSPDLNTIVKDWKKYMHEFRIPFGIALHNYVNELPF